jgi:putative addiction module CopG family antidote
MEIELTPEQDDVIRLGIEQGRYKDSADAVQRAIDLLVERERVRLELLAAIDAGDDSPESEDIVLESDEDIADFFEGVKQRGRATLAALATATPANH